MSVDFDVVDALAGLAEDLRSEGNFVERLHAAVVTMRQERDEARALLAGVRQHLPEDAWVEGLTHPENVFHFVAGAKHELNLAQMEIKALKAEIEEILKKRDSRGFKRGTAAMREAAALTCDLHPAKAGTEIAPIIRALPVAEAD